jgi:hypothetical protein
MTEAASQPAACCWARCSCSLVLPGLLQGCCCCPAVTAAEAAIPAHVSATALRLIGTCSRVRIQTSTELLSCSTKLNKAVLVVATDLSIWWPHDVAVSVIRATGCLNLIEWPSYISRATRMLSSMLAIHLTPSHLLEWLLCQCHKRPLVKPRLCLLQQAGNAQDPVRRGELWGLQQPGSRHQGMLLPSHNGSCGRIKDRVTATL